MFHTADEGSVRLPIIAGSTVVPRAICQVCPEYENNLISGAYEKSFQQVKSSQVVGLRDRLAIIRTLIFSLL